MRETLIKRHQEMKYIKYFICAFILYCYIYSPALSFMSFGIDKLVLAISIVYLVLSRKTNSYYRKFETELVLLFLIVIFSVIISTLHNGFSFDYIVMYDIFLFIEVLVVPFFIISFFSFSWKCNISKVIIYNAIFAGCVSVALLLNPGWADIMKSQILRVSDILLNEFAFRGFGFSDGLTFAYPVIQGLCIGFILCNYVRGNLIIYLGLIPLCISVFVNARSGIVPVIVALTVLIIKSPITKTLKTTIPICIVFIIVFILYTPDNDSQMTKSVEWGMSFFSIMSDFFSGKEAENMDALSLTGTMVQFPHSLSAWIMGEGVNLFGNSRFKDYHSSDIGYCIRTVYGGVLYMFLWFCLWIVMYRRLVRIHRSMALILFVSLLYLNWKSDFFIVTPSCRFFFLIYVCCIMDSSFMKYDKNKDNFERIITVK